MNVELLKKLYSVYSPSSHEDGMLSFLDEYVTENIHGKVEITYDEHMNMYIEKGSAKQFPCVVAHLDQVQHIHSDDFVAVETEDIIFGYSPSRREFEGLGADDKNGIFIALECLAKYDNIKVAFFREEEIGCIGSSCADMDFFDNCRFVIQGDRRGFADMVTNISCVELCSKEFIKATKHKKFGYRISTGAMTDVETLKDNGLKVSCINLSCGYYDPHTDNEYTIKKDLENCLNFVQYIIEHCTKVYPHEYICSWGKSSKYDKYYSKYSAYDRYWQYTIEDELFDIISNDYDFYEGMSASEIYEEFKPMYPDLTEKNVEEVLKEIY